MTLLEEAQALDKVVVDGHGNEFVQVPLRMWFAIVGALGESLTVERQFVTESHDAN